MTNLVEQVSVVALFEHGKITPEKFLWRKREYLVKSILLRFKRRDGGIKYLCFGVESEAGSVELRLDTSNLKFTILNLNE